MSLVRSGVYLIFASATGLVCAICRISHTIVLYDDVRPAKLVVLTSADIMQIAKPDFGRYGVGCPVPCLHVQGKHILILSSVMHMGLRGHGTKITDYDLEAIIFEYLPY